jgi:hypothetical protein
MVVMSYHLLNFMIGCTVYLLWAFYNSSSPLVLVTTHKTLLSPFCKGGNLVLNVN